MRPPPSATSDGSNPAAVAASLAAAHSAARNASATSILSGSFYANYPSHFVHMAPVKYRDYGRPWHDRERHRRARRARHDYFFNRGADA